VDVPVADPQCRPRVHERLAEPAEIRSFDGLPVGEGEPTVGDLLGFIGALAPRDRVLETRAFDDPSNEPVVARTGHHGLGGRRDPAGVVGGHSDVRRGRMQGDRELGRPVLERASAGGPDRVRVLRGEPRLEVREQAFARRRSWDQAALRRMTDDVGTERERGMEGRRHRTIDDSPAAGHLRGSLRTNRPDAQVRCGSAPGPECAAPTAPGCPPCALRQTHDRPTCPDVLCARRRTHGGKADPATVIASLRRGSASNATTVAAHRPVMR
jgi:hypothetical protein